MDDGRVVAVQVHQAAQNLVGPPLHHLLINVLVPLAVPAGQAWQGEAGEGLPGQSAAGAVRRGVWCSTGCQAGLGTKQLAAAAASCRPSMGCM